jgi:hypothetical protein
MEQNELITTETARRGLDSASDAPVEVMIQLKLILLELD